VYPAKAPAEATALLNSTALQCSKEQQQRLLFCCLLCCCCSAECYCCCEGLSTTCLGNRPSLLWASWWQVRRRVCPAEQAPRSCAVLTDCPAGCDSWTTLANQRLRCCSGCQDAIPTASGAAGKHCTDNPTCCVALVMCILQAADVAGKLVAGTAHQIQFQPSLGLGPSCVLT
jgi:hypothetical protein